MKILIVGGDLKGAWQMRGIQLGRALGAHVTASPCAADWAWAEIVVLVKRAATQWATEAQRARAPVVWDALDFWQQPDQNSTSRSELIADAKHIAASAGVSTIIGATRQMAEDLGGVYLPHHCRSGLRPTPPRARAEVVGYDGTKKYLGKWLPMLEQVCEAMGLRFVLNPSDLRRVDALVAFRDGRWDGEVCRAWKSGVKHVNAIAAGRPMLCHPSAALNELRPCGASITHHAQLIDGVQAVLLARDAAYEHGRRSAHEFTVDAVAEQYRAILRAAATRAA